VHDSTNALAGSWGLALVFFNVLLAQAGLPIPAAPVLVLAGAVAARDPVWGAEAVLLATVGSALGDVAWFLAGRFYGSRILRLLCRLSLSPDSCVGETLTRFERWGRKAIVVAKFVPGLSIVAPPVAGALRMKGTEFLALTLLGAALWSATYLALGVLAAPAILQLLPWAARQGLRAVPVVLVLLAGYVLLKWLERRRLIASLRSARIEPADLHARLRSARPPVMLDVRTRAAWEIDPRKLPSALHVPPEEVRTRLASMARDEEVVLYCNCPNEASAARIAKLLIDQGFTRVRPLRGGLDGWVEAGYAVERASVTDIGVSRTLAHP
jgi:membrane protein DedA with SNARE-associated domain/rhodanese-related sulfurtransferase